MKEIYSKKQFVEALRILQNVDEWDNKLYDAGIQLNDGCPLYETISEYVYMLEHMFEVKDGLISWWCWETDYGKDERMTTVTADDKEYILDSSEALYDFLIKCMNEKTEEV